MSPALRWTGRRAGGDRGSSTVLVAAAVGVLLMMLVAGMTLTAAVLARHRAEAAADLGALAGATHPARACAEARRVVQANRAVLASCEVHGSVVDVTVRVQPASAWLGPAEARSRAGRG